MTSLHHDWSCLSRDFESIRMRIWNTIHILFVLVGMLVTMWSSLAYSYYDRDYNISEELRDLSRSTVIIYAPEDPNLPCKKQGDPGCLSIGTGFAFGQIAGGTPGVIVTNKHVVKNRSAVYAFHPRERTLDWYDRDQLIDALVTFYRRVPLRHVDEKVARQCSEQPLYFDEKRNIVTNQDPNSPFASIDDDKTIGFVSAIPVLVRHEELDVAMLRACPITSAKIVHSVDCRTLKEGTTLYTVGSSRRYGMITWLPAVFESCDGYHVGFTMPIESGRSGSPIVTLEGSLVGVVEGSYQLRAQGRAVGAVVLKGLWEDVVSQFGR